MDGDLRRAVEAKGKSHGADATVDVELHVAEPEVAHDVLLTHGWKDERAVEGHADLASVGVAGEHEVDEVAARMLDDGIGVVGLVDHEDDGTIGVRGNGQVEIGVAAAGVVGAADPDA